MANESKPKSEPLQVPLRYMAEAYDQLDDVFSDWRDRYKKELEDLWLLLNRQAASDEFSLSGALLDGLAKQLALSQVIEVDSLAAANGLHFSDAVELAHRLSDWGWVDKIVTKQDRAAENAERKATARDVASSLAFVAAQARSVLTEGQMQEPHEVDETPACGAESEEEVSEATERRPRKKAGDNRELVCAALRTLHRYSDGKVTEFGPFRLSDILAEAGGVIKLKQSQVSSIMKDLFGGMAQYKSACLIGSIHSKLASVSGDYEANVAELKEENFMKKGDDS